MDPAQKNLEPFVVILDEDELTLSVLKTAFRALGIRCKCFQTGKAAAGFLHSLAPCQLPKLVIFDPVLDDTDNWNLKRLIHSNAALRATPFILFSTLQAKDFGDAIDAQVLHTYLEKPFDAQRFRATVQPLISRR